MCMVLPEVIEAVVVKGGDVRVPRDTVAAEVANVRKTLRTSYRLLF